MNLFKEISIRKQLACTIKAIQENKLFGTKRYYSRKEARISRLKKCAKLEKLQSAKKIFNCRSNDIFLVRYGHMKRMYAKRMLKIIIDW